MFQILLASRKLFSQTAAGKN